MKSSCYGPVMLYKAPVDLAFAYDLCSLFFSNSEYILLLKQLIEPWCVKETASGFLFKIKEDYF